MATVLAASHSPADEAVWVPYEPEMAHLTGTIVEEGFGEEAAPMDRGKHAWILRLERPISLRASPNDEINTAEANVREVHLNLAQAKYPEVKANLGKMRFTVSGTLYHSHTAHHLRSIVMHVTALVPVETPKAR